LVIYDPLNGKLPLKVAAAIFFPLAQTIKINRLAKIFYFGVFHPNLMKFG